MSLQDKYPLQQQPLCHGQKLSEGSPPSNLAGESYGPWPCRYDLGSSSWHTIKSLTAFMWNIIQIQLGSEELWWWHRFWVYVHYDLDLDLGDMIFGQDHDTPFGHGHQLCEILSRSDEAGKKLWTGQDMKRRTARHGDSYITPPPPTLFAGV